MKLAIIKTEDKDFCIDISKTIYNLRTDLISKDNIISENFIDFLSIMINKDDLEKIKKNKIIIIDIDEIKDPMLFIGLNMIKNINSNNE